MKILKYIFFHIYCKYNIMKICNRCKQEKQLFEKQFIRFNEEGMCKYDAILNIYTTPDEFIPSGNLRFIFCI